MITEITYRDKEIVKENICKLEDIEDKLYNMIRYDTETMLSDVWADLWDIRIARKEV